MNIENIVGYNYLKEQEKIELAKQIERYNALSLKEIKYFSPIVNEKGILKIEKGTIIHGTSYNEKSLYGISKSGILTGQAIGIKEDGETFFCADFHRVPTDVSMDKYNDWFPYNDGKCPFGKRENISASRSIAFVIKPNVENEELLKYDCYRDTREGEITKKFINYLPMKNDLAASILYGVPSNCISGIIVGSRVMESQEKIKFLINLFPKSYIAYRTGEIIYDPNKSIDKSDYIEEKSKRLYQEKIVTDKESENKELVSNNQRLKESYDNLFSAILENGDIELISKVLKSIGWQVEDEHLLETAQRMKENKRVGRNV